MRRQPAFDRGSRGHPRRHPPASRGGRRLGRRARAVAAGRRLLRARTRGEPERRGGVAGARPRRALSRRRPRAVARRGQRDAAVRGADAAGSRASGRRSTASRARGSSGASSIRRRSSTTCRTRRCARSPRRTARPPYDVPDVAYTHVGPECSFDAFIRRHELDASGARRRCADIVRAADTSTLQLAAQAPGLLAASLGLSAMFADDHAMLKWGMLVYDSLYAWCREAQTETHGWYPEQAARRRASVTHADSGRARRADARRGLPLLAEARLRELRRPGGPDRDHASRSRRLEALDLRAAFPARAQLLHGAARARRRSSSRPTSAGSCTGRGAAWSPARCSCCRRSSLLIALSWLYSRTATCRRSRASSTASSRRWSRSCCTPRGGSARARSSGRCSG